MAAITLGLAEVEERLQALRWRLNFRTAQHGIYVVAATAATLCTILILVGLRASPATFRIVAWASGLVLLLVALACLFHGWRTWRDIRGVALLADEHGQLADRLTTLADLRPRQRTSRLAPVLVAQTLALGAHWQPHRIVPRRVPHSVFLLIAALLVLAATTVVERQPRQHPGLQAAPRSQPAESDRATTAARRAGGRASTASASRVLAGTQVVDNKSRSGPVSGAGPESRVAMASRSGADGPSNKAHDAASSITDRLQQAIADTFGADKREVSGTRRRRGGNATTGDTGAPADDDPRLGGDKYAKHAVSEQAGGAGGNGRGAAGAGQKLPQRSGSTNVPTKFAGDSPGAGEGSSPGDLMQTTAPEFNVDASASKTFTLTITSVPRAREAHGAPADQAATAPGTHNVAATGADNTLALSDRQLADDALRKAEIPPEYEDLIRGVFVSRSGR